MLKHRPLASFAILAFFALLPGVAVGGGLGLALLVAAAGTASLSPGLARAALAKAPPLALTLFLAFVGWAVLSAAWSPYRDHIQAPKLAAITLLGLAFAFAAARDAHARRLTRAGAQGACLALLALLAVEWWGTPLNRAAAPDLPDWMLQAKPATGVVILLGLIWAAAGRWAASARPGAAWLAIAAAGFFALRFDQLANFAAFGLGLAAFIAGLLAPRFSVRLVAGGAAAWVLAAPFATPLLFADPALMAGAPYSWAARIGIWNYTSAHIAEAPLIGHGLDASRAVSERISVQGESIRAIELHPHSAALQIWYETGAAGAALAAAALLAGGFALARAFGPSRHASAAASATIACIFVSANLSYGLWQEWWNAAMFLAGAVLAAYAPKARQPKVESGLIQTEANLL